jgi:multidrug resistance efflux pump
LCSSAPNGRWCCTTRTALEGDRVKKGQFLLQIDPASPRAAARSTEASMLALSRDVESARANLEQARLDFRRAEENHLGRIRSAS